MLSVRYRFVGQKAIRRVQKYGKQYRCSYIAIRALPNNRKSSRLAVVVSKKVSKKAVVRNRIRRRIYEIFRKKWDLLAVPSDIVVNVYDERLATINPAELEKIIITSLDKASLTIRPSGA